MKKIILILMVLGLCGQVNAQKRYFNKGTGKVENNNNNAVHQSNIYYGARVGLAFNTMHSSDANFNFPSNRTGLMIGGVVGYNLIETLDFESGLFYVSKGGTRKESAGNKKYNLDYLEIPLLFKYRFNLNNMVNLQPILGAYIGIGVGGKYKDYQNEVAYDAFGGDKDQLKRVDGGLKLGVGAEVSVFYLELAYDLGLANISHNDFYSAHNRNLTLALGVNF